MINTWRRTKRWSYEGYSQVCYYLPYISAALLTLSLAHYLINPKDLNLLTNNA